MCLRVNKKQDRECIMKKLMFFVGIMAVCLSVKTVNAEIAGDTSSYPEYKGEAQTVGGQTYAAGSIKSNKITVATTKFVNNHAGVADGAVQTLTDRANTDKGTVTTNGTDITALQGDRQVVPNDNVCDNLGTQYSGCGYIAADGADAVSNDKTKYKWVKIIARP